MSYGTASRHGLSKAVHADAFAACTRPAEEPEELRGANGTTAPAFSQAWVNDKLEQQAREREWEKWRAEQAAQKARRAGPDAVHCPSMTSSRAVSPCPAAPSPETALLLAEVERLEQENKQIQAEGEAFKYRMEEAMASFERIVTMAAHEKAALQAEVAALRDDAALAAEKAVHEAEGMAEEKAGTSRPKSETAEKRKLLAELEAARLEAGETSRALAAANSRAEAEAARAEEAYARLAMATTSAAAAAEQHATEVEAARLLGAEQAATTFSAAADDKPGPSDP